MPRVLDERATKIARNRHQRGIDKLNMFFGWPQGIDCKRNEKFHLALVPLKALMHGTQTGVGKPFRMRPNTPPVRDPEHQKKHKQRQRVNAARRKNRV